MWRASRSGSYAPWRLSTCGANGARIASASGWTGPTRAPVMRTRSPQLACGCVAAPPYGVTTLVDLGRPVTMADVDLALRQAFEQVFGSVRARLPEATI